MFANLAEQLSPMVTLLSPTILFFLLIGVICGLLVGALPGFGAAQALALLLPFTYQMEALPAILFLLAIYSAAEYGGSIPAILVRTPGTTAAAMTTIEGYAMAKKGLARRALRISLYGAMIGGVTSTIVFIAAAPLLAWIGLQFGPSEMFALGVFGLAVASSLFGKSMMKGVLAAGIGLWLGTIGDSGFSGMRFTFGSPYLYDGVPTLIVIIGLLAVPEAFRLFVDSWGAVGGKSGIITEVELGRHETDNLPLRDVRRLMPSFLRGSFIGTLIGALPGGGATVASIIAYSEERRWSRHPEKFGTGEGVEEGLASPETANNAVVAGALVPTLSLGIPGSAAAAILLGMLISKGVAPGPLLFQTEMDFIVLVFVGLLLCNILLFAVGFAATRPFAFITRVPSAYLGPFILVLLLIGAYAYRLDVVHIPMVLALGVAGYLFERIGVPVVPIVLANVMQPIIEENLARAVTIASGDLSFLITRPLTAVILAASVISAVWALVREHRRSARPVTNAIENDLVIPERR